VGSQEPKISGKSRTEYEWESRTEDEWEGRRGWDHVTGCQEIRMGDRKTGKINNMGRE
jgi:hypothetical protein